MQENKRAFTLRVSNPDVECVLIEGETITDAVKKVSGRHPLIGCLGGGCGISAVQISEEDKKNGIVLACKTYPTSDLSCTVLGRKSFL